MFANSFTVDSIKSYIKFSIHPINLRTQRISLCCQSFPLQLPIGIHPINLRTQRICLCRQIISKRLLWPLAFQLGVLGPQPLQLGILFDNGVCGSLQTTPEFLGVGSIDDTGIVGISLGTLTRRITNLDVDSPPVLLFEQQHPLGRGWSYAQPRSLCHLF